MNRKWLRSSLCRAAFLLLLVMLACQIPAAIAWAQGGPATKNPAAPPTAPAPPAAPKTGSTEPAQENVPFKIIENVHLVTTPVTVFDSSGQFVYDLEKDEFKIYDNGELQDIKQFDSEMRRLSLVIVVETNDTTVPFLDSVRPLGSMFSDLVMGPQGEVAVLTYSDHVDEPLDFTSDGDKLDTVLRGLHGRGGGMHLDDAIARALSMLDHRPKEDRKVVIIFSDGYNIGSQTHRSEIVKRAMNSDITVYGLGFSPVTGFVGQARQGSRSGFGGGKCGAVHALRTWPPHPPTMRTPGTRRISRSCRFFSAWGKKRKSRFSRVHCNTSRGIRGAPTSRSGGRIRCRQALNRIATEIHSQYELAYSPSNGTEVGFHKIEVQVRRPGAKVRARAGWFYQGEPARGAEG